MRVLLVIAQQQSMKSYQLPVGIGYISASLKRAGHEVRVLNPNHSVEPLETQLEQAIAEFKPAMLGVGGMSFHMKQIRRIVIAARPLMPDSVIVVGGVILSNHPDVTMRALPEADIGVVGEGEQTIVELAAALESGGDINAVDGIIYWAVGRKLIRTATRPIEKNLDSLPWVDWEGLGLDIYSGLHGIGEMAPGLIVEPGARVMPFLSSRGCPFSCTFCCHEIAGRRYRTRSMDDVFAELEYAIDKFGIDHVAIYDDIFCLKKKNLHEFCERIRPESALAMFLAGGAGHPGKFENHEGERLCLHQLRRGEHEPHGSGEYAEKHQQGSVAKSPGFDRRGRDYSLGQSYIR